jgi:steroid delta-isomerase-like uncharacterized protein
MDIDAAYAALNRHDGEAYASNFTEDGVLVDHVDGTRHQGREAIRAYVKAMEDEFSSDFQVAEVDSFQTADRFVSVWDMSGTHDRSSQQPPLPATGKQFTIRGVVIGSLEGDKVKEETVLYNLAEFLAQVGLMPAPASTGG